MIADLRVLDLGWVWAGPLVGSALADLGADVVKVESAARLDPYRLRGVERDPRYSPEERVEASPSFHKLNRSKRSLCINLRVPGARELLLRLVEVADVLIENFSGGTLDRLELSWDVLHQHNRRLVVASMSAGGQRGRWRDLRAYALVTTAMAGYEHQIAYPGEQPIGGATFGIADPTVSSFGVFGVLAAIWNARQTGVGCALDLSGVESVITATTDAYIETARPLRLELCTPCAEPDTWVAAVLSEQAQLDALTGVLSTDLAAWSGLADPSVREDLEHRLAAWSSVRTRTTVADALVAAGVPAAPVLAVEERDRLGVTAPSLSVVHPVTGAETFLPSPWGTTTTPRPAPLLGQHTADVLRQWLGLDDDEIDSLAAAEILR